jgi:hypothetical protein
MSIKHHYLRSLPEKRKIINPEIYYYLFLTILKVVPFMIYIYIHTYIYIPNLTIQVVRSCHRHFHITVHILSYCCSA